MTFIQNQFNDDLTLRNYLALMACILNPDLNHNRALNLFDISDKKSLEINPDSGSFKKSSNKHNRDFKKIKVIDTLNNNEIIFNSVYEAENYTGIKKENIYVYIPRGILGGRRYKFYYYND
ncbi:hypothetical protein UMC2PCS14_00881 (plasmid) [[Clostridium] sordellii]|uniref:hypothetical protein n=1 Tax=Paraclostridium sordellii TaxID=1505 RepID=UPI0005406F3A|nr:hypothetical protein [Paeniclostridium sordellii]CEK36664.1 hypothetical protein UMC2PCS14_00881 (plasmid) [[Clostridium] sordellii] [Paeniclostridium sordellii]